MGRLRRAAADVSADLRRATEGLWRCDVADDYVLTVTFGDDTESVLLKRALEDEDWYLAPGLPPERQAEALDVHAAEVVADETLDVIGARGWPCPSCQEHGRALSSCSGVWLCDGPPGHEVARVGRLGE